MYTLCPRRFAALLACLSLYAIPLDAAPPATSSHTSAVKIITLGDSITKGVRRGVEQHETFAAIVEQQLKSKGIDAEVTNVGIGGERTDQALKRLGSVTAQRPHVVTVMYGTNDSYVDPGKNGPRLSRDEYKRNLGQLVMKLRDAGCIPVLMTEPRWRRDATNGIGENANAGLEPFVIACREVARELEVPLVDHYAHWAEAEKQGQAVSDWTTDGCHPNPRGHAELARTMLPVLLEVIE